VVVLQEGVDDQSLTGVQTRFLKIKRYVMILIIKLCKIIFTGESEFSIKIFKYDNFAWNMIDYSG